MTPSARTLEEALASMRFRCASERFILIGVPPTARAELLAVAAAAPPPVNVVLEGDVASYFGVESAAAPLRAIAGARTDGPYRLITFETPMSWDVVGFLALATRALADAGVPLGAVCGFDRDHLFVREPFLDAARAALRARVCAEA